MALCDEYINSYTGNDILPKFELLKATALMYVEGFMAYKNAINFVALTYPQSEEGKQAQEIYTRVLPGLASSEFSSEGDKYKIVYRFKGEQQEAQQAYLGRLPLPTSQEKIICQLGLLHSRRIICGDTRPEIASWRQRIWRNFSRERSLSSIVRFLWFPPKITAWCNGIKI